MTIKKGDIKLVQSEVMSDDPEGGGPPTSIVVQSGVSNALFPDISEVDRAAGRVNARKLHVWIQSKDTASFLGPNVIIAEPPNDPNVSITLMTTNDVFDRRAAAISRVESYLTRGAAYEGFLYGDMVAGQQIITVYQRTPDLPAIGSTLALTKRQGYANEYTQYVRITDALAKQRTFTDANGDFQRYVLEIRLSDPLRADFAGHAVTRTDPTPEQLATNTRIYGSVVADAAKYAGVSRLKVAAGLKDFTVKVESIFSQLVPSAQIETPIADARTNQLFAGLVAAGAAITRTVQSVFTPTQSLYVGGGIKPGTLTVTGSAVTLQDSGGKLLNGGEQVGTVDYDNGILSLLSPVYGTDGVTLTLAYQPARAVQAVTQSQGFKITQSSRASSFVQPIEPPPVRGSLSIAYRSGGSWYVLRDQGDGKLVGADSSFGAGSVNFDTGTVVVTLGALPDVGTELIYQWVEPAAAVDADQLKLENDGRLYWPINVDGLVTEEAGSRAIVPGQIALVWSHGGMQYSATDNGRGQLTGDALGTVNYAKGTMRVSPKVLPPVGTAVTINTDTSAYSAYTNIVPVAGKGNFGYTQIRPGTISFSIVPKVTLRFNGGAFVDGPVPAARPVRDRDGALWMLCSIGGYGVDVGGSEWVQIGTVDYATGDFEIVSTVQLPTASPKLLPFMQFNNFYFNQPRAVFNSVAMDILR